MINRLLHLFGYHLNEINKPVNVYYLWKNNAFIPYQDKVYSIAVCFITNDNKLHFGWYEINRKEFWDSTLFPANSDNTFTIDKILYWCYYDDIAVFVNY